MKNYFALPLLALLTSFSFIGNDWFKTQIDKTVSVQFPLKADKDKSSGQEVFISSTDAGIFTATSMKLPEKFKVPEDATEMSKLLNGVMDGTMKSIRGTITSKKDGLIGVIPVKEAKFTGTFPGTDTEGIGYKRILITGRVLYAFEYWPLVEENEDTETERNTFFDSIEIAAK